MKTQNIIIGTLAAGVLAGGAVYLNNQLNVVYNTSYELVRYRLSGLGDESIRLVLYLKLKNESNFNLHIKSYKFTIYVNGKKITVAEDHVGQDVPKKQDVVLPVPVRIFPKQIKDVIVGDPVSLLLNPGKVSVTTRGNISLKGSFFEANRIPIDYTTSLAELQREQ